MVNLAPLLPFAQLFTGIYGMFAQQAEEGRLADLKEADWQRGMDWLQQQRDRLYGADIPRAGVSKGAIRVIHPTGQEVDYFGTPEQARAAGMQVVTDHQPGQVDRISGDFSQRWDDFLGGQGGRWDALQSGILDTIQRHTGYAQTEFNRAFDPISAAVANMSADANQQWGDFSRDITGGYAQMLADSGSRWEDMSRGVLGGYAERLDTARDLTQGMGKQRRVDINQNFANLGSETQQRLMEQGLGGTTIGSSMAAGVERERTNALGRLEEDLLGARLGVEQTFGGALDAARERLGTSGALLANQQQAELLGARERLGAAGFDIAQAGRQAELDTLRQRQLGHFQLGQEGRAEYRDANMRLGMAGFLNQQELGMTGLREQERLAMMPIDYDIATLNPMLAWQASLDRGVPGTNPWLGISELIGGMMEQRAAAQQARAQEKAADQSFWGQIFGGGVNAGTQIGSSYIMADALKSRGGGFDPWFMMSDVNAKEDFEHVDADMILQRVEELTIQRWRYKDDPLAAKHIGPMAQDFEETFGLGSNPRHIDVVDAFGVALAAIQALAKRVRELEGQSHRRTAVAAVGGGH